MTEPTTFQLATLIASIVFFIVGGAISLSRLWNDFPKSRILAKIAMYVGLVFSITVLIWRAVGRHSWQPLESNFESPIWLALALAGFVLYVQRRRPLNGLDWFVMPIVVVLLILSAVIGITNPRNYDVHSLWSLVHRITAYGGAGFFAIAAAAGTMYLIVNRRLRNKNVLAGPNLGSLERLEHLSFSAVTIGFAMLTVGALTGFMKMSFDQTPALQTKVILSIFVWLVYAIVLHSPINPSFRGPRAAMLSVIGFGLMVGAIVASLMISA
jgi:ABC-type uncharacterized transport system permease subunit